MTKKRTTKRRVALRVTPGRAWRQPREEGYVGRLPSGNVARLRPVDLPTLLASGQIPDILTPLAAAMMFEGPEAVGKQPGDPVKLKQQTVQMIEFYNAVCRASFVEPRIVESPQADDEIAIEDISLEDRGFVFEIATKGVRALKFFRDQPLPSLGPVQRGPDDGAEAEYPGGD